MKTKLLPFPLSALLLAAIPASAQQYKTAIPPAITIPDRVETRLVP